MNTRRIPAALLAAATLAAALAGCGSPARPAGGDERGPLLAFTACMRERGIALADPVVEGDSVKLLPAEGAPPAPKDRFDAAHEQCRALLPDGLEQLGRPPEAGAVQAREEAALRFADCVREEGYDVPDPRFADGRVTNWDPEALGIDLDDPQVQRVAERCTGESGYDPREG